MVGSMNAFEIFSTSKADVVFALRYKGSSANIVQHTYTPNDKNRITLSVKDIILPLLSFEVKDSSEPYAQPNIMKSFVATLYEVGSEGSKKEFTFSVIRAGVDRLSDSATNFLKNNFLTWQPQVKAVTYYSPEFLTYYATATSVMKCKAYMWNGTAYEEKEVVLMNHMNAGTVYTVPVQYAIIAKKIGGSIQPSYYDIWVEQDGKRVTYVQRYYASDMKSEEEEWFLFENSLGGVDCFRAYGNSENTAEHTHNVAEIEEDSEEYRVDTTRKFKKNTGFLDKKERLWMLDFFPSLGKYVYHGNSLRKITVTESDVNYEAKELPSNYTFTYKYSDARPYLNLTRSDASDFKQMDIHLPEIGNFTIAPRLVEFPRQLLSGGVLFPVQEPYSETWGVTTADALFNYFASTLSDRYSGGGGIGHQHFNIEVLNGLSYDYGYILYQGDRIKAGMADDCTPGGALEKKMLRKDIDDTAKGKITFEDMISLLKGLKLGDGKSQITGEGLAKLYAFMTYNFVSGAYGSGASIDNNGDAEMNSLFVRQFISAPKFVFNEISVTKAEQWNTNGYGTIESVDTGKHIISLHLEGNDYGSLQVGDICRGIYADIDNAHGSDKNTEGALDDCNFVLHKGFFTTYFYVKKIITSEKGKFVFEYGKRSEATPDPCAYMDFAQYGSFTDDKRQSSMYFSSRGNSYIEVLDGVCNWEVLPQNRVARYGWLSGLALTKRDGSIVRPEGNGIYVQDNIYFGGNINYLQGLSGLDDLKNEAKAYDVSLSQYQSVITVDDMGNVINGLYTQDEGKATKQYRISTAVFVRKGMDILLEEDANSEDVTEGHYRLYVVSEDCDVEVKNSTVFIKGVKNIKDGVAGTADDTNFDYAAMRKMSDAMVTIVVELEGKISKTVQMPIRIQHDSLPFMVCDLSNESASVAWNTRAGKYIGFPIKTKVSLMYHNEPWEISSLNISKVAGLKTSMSIDGKAKVITIDADNLTADTLDQVTKLDITVVGKYAGASYEYTRELTILKSSDMVVYELIPSADSVIIDNQGNMSAKSISCDIWATSSDDKRYKLTELPAGYHLKHGTADTPDTDMEIGAEVSVQSNARQVVFALYDASGNVLDKESVPVLTCGADGEDGKDGKDGDGLIVGYQSSASEPSVLPTPKTLADYDKAQDDIGSGWTKTAPATGGKSIVLGGKITTDEIIDRYNSSTSAWGTEESEILLDGIKQKKTFYKTPSSLGGNGKCIRRIKVVNHFRDSYIRVMLKSYSEANYDLVCISRLYLPSEVINSEGKQIKEDSEYLNRSEHAYVVSGDGQSLVAKLSMPDAGEYYFFIGYFKDGGTDSYGDYGLFAWQSMIALTESLWRSDGTVDAVGNITWSKAMPMQAETIVMERAYIATTNDTVAPAKPYRTNGILQGGWTAKRLTVSSTNRFIWESVRTGKHGTDSVQGDWSQPVVVANFAEAGKMGKNGCIVRNSEGWKSGTTYHNDSAMTLEQKYLDLIYIEDSNANDGWSVYQCNVTHTATGSFFDPSAVDSNNNKLWVKLSDAGPMYCPLIVGKNAVLKFAQGQQFNLMEGNNIFGSFRWVKNKADYAFWIGGTEGSTATTSITRGGKLTAKDAVITGTINATSGQIGGLKITDAGLSIGSYSSDAKGWELKNGTMLEHSSLWLARTNSCVREVAAGRAADLSPVINSDGTVYHRNQRACDMYGSALEGYANNNAMIIRKYSLYDYGTGDYQTVRDYSDPSAAALNVDTDGGIGIRSVGGNLLGCIAQNVLSMSAAGNVQQNAINNNRVGIILMTNSSAVDIKLPKYPMTGQMLIVIQGNSRIYFDPVVSGRRLYCCGKIHTTSDKFYSDDVGQFNILIWDGYNWQLQYIYH
ncbi:hypothetical protein ONT23_06065 [Prevotella copri]|uniref:Uncharacterized protein n=2 Tax=Segatella copri TaxID=165179 RepID=A0AAW5URN6_9BACT|nr:hypothetical protein [Segatella copri]MCW4121350.1 hypothetical protein [Segatella copri]MCW4155116.1 hypothetical protein [Segatella copri]